MVPAPKKKSTKKKSATVKKAKSSKLGHDPLSWIDETEAESLKAQNESKTESENLVEDAVEEVVASEDQEVGEENNAVVTEVENTEENEMFELPLYFGIAQVADVRGQMESLLNSEVDELEIKCEEIESIDTAAIQLLIAFVQDANKKGKSIKWVGQSEKLKSAIDLLNVKDAIAIA